MDIIETLQNIGLNKNEVRVYLALLQVDDSMARALAHKTKLHRANVYDALDSLISKGLVSFTVIDQKKHFKAKPAESIVDFIKSKQTGIERISPELKRISSFKEQKNNINLSEGVFALKEAVMNLLNEGEEILIYGVPEIREEQLLGFVEDFNKERARLKIPARYIYTSKNEDWLKKIAKYKNTEVKYFSSKAELNVTIILSGNKSLIVIWSKPILIIVIEHKDVENFFKQEFEVLWKHAKTL